jgi:hypothetical protein
MSLNRCSPVGGAAGHKWRIIKDGTARFGRASTLLKLLATLFALSLLQACSGLKLAYSNAPSLSYWWLDGYVDFADAQRVPVKNELARLHLWHRTQELPKIAVLLQKAQAMAPGELTGEPICAMYADARERFVALTQQAESASVALAMSLSPAQITHIERKYDKTNAEWRDDWLDGSATERREKRLKASTERAEEFYGKLEERQLAVLRARMETSSFDAQLSYGERLRRQQDLLQILRMATGASGTMAKPAPATVATALRGYIERTDHSPNLAYRSYSDKLITENCQTFADLHNSTSTAQRERAARRLAAYERDAKELQVIR